MMNEAHTSKSMWIARAGQRGMFFQEFVDKGHIAITGALTPNGENKVGDLSGLTSKEMVQERVDQAFPHGDSRRKSLLADGLHKYCNVMQIGDYVLTYSPSERIYALGKITSEYIFEPSLDRPHTRKTDYYQRTISRNELSSSTKNALTAVTFIYLIQPEARKEILSLLGQATSEKSIEQPQQTEADDGSKLEGQFDFQSLSTAVGEFIKDRIVSLKWDEMEKLVAGLLRAMGYQTRRTPKGPDGGVDIVASKDALGFEKPTIAVEVKHRPKQSIATKDIRSFQSACNGYDGGLFVSTGGFTKNARQFAQNSQKTIIILDIDLLLDYLLEHYDKLDDETQSLLPLGKLYWPKE